MLPDGFPTIYAARLYGRWLVDANEAFVRAAAAHAGVEVFTIDVAALRAAEDNLEDVLTWLDGLRYYTHTLPARPDVREELRNLSPRAWDAIVAELRRRSAE